MGLFLLCFGNMVTHFFFPCFLVSILSGLFYEIQQGTQWFKTKKDNDETYGLVGLLLGLAVYNGVVLDLHFPRCVSVCLFDVWEQRFPRDQHQPSRSLKEMALMIVVVFSEAGLQKIVGHCGQCVGFA
jgi:uncharacterized membrane protein